MTGAFPSHTEGQHCGKRLHFMTLSWFIRISFYTYIYIYSHINIVFKCNFMSTSTFLSLSLSIYSYIFKLFLNECLLYITKFHCIVLAFSYTENWKLSACQLWRHWRQHRVSFCCLFVVVVLHMPGFARWLTPGRSSCGSTLFIIIARPKGVPPKAARPKDGLFRLHASWIYLFHMVSQYTSCIAPRNRVQVVPPAASDSCNNTLP